jgi:aminopeptidase N
MKKMLMLLILAVSLQAIIDEEKPCGHAHSGNSLSKVAVSSAEQQKIDIHYYKLYFDMNIFVRSMRCEFQIDLSVLDTSLQTIELDYSTYNLGVDNITVREVVLNGDTVAFSHNNDLISIPIIDSLELGEMMTVLIYSHTGSIADEKRTDNQGFNWDKAREGVYTNSQPYDARDWWPSVDYPRDKADSLDMVVRINDHLIVASNGRLDSTVDIDDGYKTWHWHVGYPIATYLVSLSIYDFYEWNDVYVDENNNSLPILFYTYTPPENPSPWYMTQNYRLLPEMMTLYAGQFGPYPFMDEKYGHAEWGENYGMEHQTLTSMGDPTERRVAHELAHMWFGDMITCNSYHDIWLNEGFATYAEALWWEHRYGISGYKEKMASFEYYGTGTIYVEDPETQSIFTWSLSYAKAAWVLHMLRGVVGDETFFEILQTYAADLRFKHKTATTAQFQMVCEDVSGIDLDSFFQQWIYGSLYPKYQVIWSQANNELSVEINQFGTVFDMPVDLRISSNTTIIDTVVRIDQQTMSFTHELADGELVSSLVLDRDDWVLNTASYTVGVENDESMTPHTFKLDQNYPNPFNPSTTIPYSLGEDGNVRLRVFDVEGREVIELMNSWQSSGQYRTNWNSFDHTGKAAEAGVYFYKLEAGSNTAIKKLVLLR